MRFIAIIPFVTIVGATDKVCSEDIVRTAESQGFISSIYNCIWNEDTTIGSQACLAAFIEENAGDNPHPITDGPCRDAYQALVDVWPDLVPDYCALNDIPAGSNPIIDKAQGANNCLEDALDDTNAMSPMSVGFYGATGFFPFRMCTGAEVRNGDFSAFIPFLTGSGSWDGISGESACEFCYSRVAYNGLQNPPSDCLGTSLTTDACLSTTFMINAQEAFLQCAGYDIFTVGNMCTANGIQAVEALIPAPYYTFAQCAYHPEIAFCSTTQAYLDQIEAETDSTDCLACYTELQADLLALAETDNVCVDDLYSDECLAYQADALTAFETCSGFTLSTAVGTVAPSVTTSAPTDTTTIEEATTVAATTTTKSSYAFTALLLAAVVLCL